METETGGFLPTQTQQEAGVVAATAREQHEIQAAFIMAKRFPRDEAAAYTRIMRSCDRLGMAEDALYKFPRGGQQIEGPSVRLAREIARCWGNIRSGVRIVSLGEKTAQVKGYAQDMETNAYREYEAEFNRLVQRKNRQTGVTEWQPADERELRELVNKHGAVCERNAILTIIPSDLIEDAITRSKHTVKQAAAGNLKTNREDVIKKLALAFEEIGVSTEMLVAYLGHKLDLITEDEVVDLKAVGKSIKDGHTKREEHFSFGSASDSSAELNNMLAGDKKRGKEK